MKNRSVSLLSYQAEALQSTHSEVLVSGGIGSGKSLLGSHFIINRIAQHPNCECLISANTYSQLMNASVKTLIGLLDELGIEYTAVLSGARKRIQIGKATVYLYSLDKPDSIRGIEVSFAWLDEVAFSNLNALNVVRGRMRGKHSPYRQILMTSSPNGYNFCYDIFGNLDPKDAYKKLIQVKTKENVFLPDGYYRTLVENYGGEDTPLAQQELFGKFVNLQEGGIYNLFDRKINCRPCSLDKRHPVFVGVDFNVDMMSATYIQHIDGVFYQCEEVQLTHRNANTVDLADRILSDLVSKGYDVRIVPDSTGKARKSSATSAQSDHQIMRDKGLRVLDTSNPFIRDRQNNLNIKFHKEQLVIDPSCTATIKEIETLSSRDKEGSVSHLSVTTGYVCWFIDPLRRPTPKAKQIHL